MSGKATKPPRKKAAKLYKMPDPIPLGEVLSDMKKKQWIIGKSIGLGGFGEIYAAAEYTGTSPKDYPYVIKIEPHGNGPLFVEMHFYMRNAKPDDIDTWKRKHKLSDLGMPRYIGSGSHECNKTKYRFVVMERFGCDLWKLFIENDKKFPEHTVYKIGLQLLNVLEYIHDKTYVHADIKGANLLQDLKNPNQVYLVDFGLASRYTTETNYKLDPRKAHNGTIEYTSRDAHMGVPTMRGDIEILGYNMIHWLCGCLPWEKHISDSVTVQKEKEKAFDNIASFLDKCFSTSVPSSIKKYMTLLASMKFRDTPDYNKFKAILIDGLKQLGHKPDGKLEFKYSIGSIGEKNDMKKATPKPSVKKTVKKTVTSSRKSPRLKRSRSPSPTKENSLDTSTVGIILDKKRGNVKDLKKVLDSIESDEEYDIKIVKKTKIKQAESKRDDKTIKKNTPVKNSSRKATKNKYEDSDSDPEILPKGTKSRITKNTKSASSGQFVRKALCASDDDIFDD
ncbi:serine/threonine-protein kinase VRK1-like [Prorops nasuta]|uniref:serine/threonine-protein kinase VRK1-like n=1 Tax=Prorops nasuta TaxID=863751 RepID=UPI0034CE2B3B